MLWSRAEFGAEPLVTADPAGVLPSVNAWTMNRIFTSISGHTQITLTSCSRPFHTPNNEPLFATQHSGCSTVNGGTVLGPTAPPVSLSLPSWCTLWDPKTAQPPGAATERSVTSPLAGRLPTAQHRAHRRNFLATFSAHSKSATLSL